MVARVAENSRGAADEKATENAAGAIPLCMRVPPAAPLRSRNAVSGEDDPMAKITIPTPKSVKKSHHQQDPSGGSSPSTTEQIAALAYHLWESRACPDGSAEMDWYQAEEELQSVSSSGGRASAANS